MDNGRVITKRISIIGGLGIDDKCFHLEYIGYENPSPIGSSYRIAIVESKPSDKRQSNSSVVVGKIWINGEGKTVIDGPNYMNGGVS